MGSAAEVGAGVGVAVADRAGAARTGWTNKEVAARQGVSQPTVGKWRQRFVGPRLDGPARRAAAGSAAVDRVEQVEDVVVATLEIHAGERDALVAGEDG